MDTETDDFANDKDIIKLREQQAAFKKMMDESIAIVADAIGATCTSHKNLKGFELHKSISLPYIDKSFKGKWGRRDFYFSVFHYETAVHAGRIHDEGSDHYFCGVIELSKTFPHTVAQPETIALKLTDLITKTDVDFDHARKFSRRFHVATEDKDKLQLLLQHKALNKLADFPGAEFELLGNECYFRAGRKPVSLEQAELFTDLAKALMEIF